MPDVTGALPTPELLCAALHRRGERRGGAFDFDAFIGASKASNRPRLRSRTRRRRPNPVPADGPDAARASENRVSPIVSQRAENRSEAVRVATGDVVPDGYLVKPPAWVISEPFGQLHERAPWPRAATDERAVDVVI